MVNNVEATVEYYTKNVAILEAITPESEKVGAIYQFQRGYASILTNSEGWELTAGARGSVLGKSSISQRLDPLSDADTLEMKFSFMVPEGSPTSSIFIADFEAAGGGNPGVRLQLKDGVLIAERDKLGISDRWFPETPETIETGRWYDVSVALVQGKNAEGSLRVLVDGKLHIDETGTTRADGTSIDRMQFGVTGNSNDVDAVVQFKDVSFASSSDLAVSGRIDPLKYAVKETLMFDEDELQAETDIFVTTISETTSFETTSMSGKNNFLLDNDMSILIDFTTGADVTSTQVLIMRDQDYKQLGDDGFLSYIEGDKLIFQFEDDTEADVITFDIAANSSYVFSVEFDGTRALVSEAGGQSVDVDTGMDWSQTDTKWYVGGYKQSLLFDGTIDLLTVDTSDPFAL